MKPATRFWTEAETDLLLSGEHTDEEVAALTGRTPGACETRRICLRTGVYTKGFVKDWDAEQDQRLETLLKTHTFKETAEAMGRTYAAVKKRAYDFGFTPALMIRPIPGLGPTKIKRWTKKECAWLFNNAGTLTIEEAAEHLGRTRGAVRQFCRRNRIRWSRGGTTGMDLCKEFGVSYVVVQRVLHALFPTKIPGKNVRWALTDEEADRARVCIRARMAQWKTRSTK